MTQHPCVIDEGLSLEDAMDRMLANNIRHLVVLRGSAMVGVIDGSDLSLANAVMQRPLADIPVSKATRGVFCCAPDMPLVDVIRTMESQHFGCVVIVDHHEVVGIFTLTDALRALRQQIVEHEVPPLRVATHEPELDDERQLAGPRARAKRIVERRGATPSASDGLAFGSVGL